MKFFGAECNNSREAGQRGLCVNFLANIVVALEAGQTTCQVEHQKLTLKSGSEDSYHYHRVAYDIFTVEEGNLAAFVNGESIPLKRRDAIIVEPGDRHKIVNHGSESATLIETRLNVCKGDRYPA